jgi:hypothetical protein
MNSALVKRKRTPKLRKTEFSTAKSRFSATHSARMVVDEDETDMPVDTLYRTKRLLLAALRVWELKNGLRPEAVRWVR